MNVLDLQKMDARSGEAGTYSWSTISNHCGNVNTVMKA